MLLQRGVLVSNKPGRRQPAEDRDYWTPEFGWLVRASITGEAICEDSVEPMRFVSGNASCVVVSCSIGLVYS